MLVVFILLIFLFFSIHSPEHVSHFKDSGQEKYDKSHSERQTDNRGQSRYWKLKENDYFRQRKRNDGGKKELV